MSHTADTDDADIAEPAKLHGGYAKGHHNLVTLMYVRQCLGIEPEAACSRAPSVGRDRLGRITTRTPPDAGQGSASTC